MISLNLLCRFKIWTHRSKQIILEEVRLMEQIMDLVPTQSVISMRRDFKSIKIKSKNNLANTFLWKKQSHILMS